MFNRMHYFAYVLLLLASIAAAEEKRDTSEPKVLSGMSIVGNNETPKSLYIVPWKNAEAGKDISFSSSIMKDELKPVDRSDFVREIELHKLGNPE